MLTFKKKVEEIKPLLIGKNENKHFFEECILENVKGIETANGEDIVEEMNLYSVQDIPKIFDLFIPDADPGLMQDYLKLKDVT